VDRTRVIPALYGYSVCLIAVIVFLICIAGIVNNAFRVANPASGAFHRPVAMHGFRFMHRGFGHRGGFRQPQATPNASGETPSGAVSGPSTNFRDAFIARARLNAVRRLTLSVVLLIVSVLLFAGHWRWLHASQPASHAA